MKRIVKKIAFFIVLFSVFALTLSANGGQEKVPDYQNSAKDYQAKDKTGQAKVYKVAFIPFDQTTGNNELWAFKTLRSLGEAMKGSGAFEIYSVRDWVYGKYMDKPAPAVDKLISDARDAGIETDFICHGVVFKSGTDVGIKVSLYPMDDKVNVTHYFRYFYNPSGSDDVFATNVKVVAAQMVEEMSNRCKRDGKFAFDKKIYMKQFNLKMLLYNRVPSGLEQLTQVPFLTIGGVDYKSTDNFFGEMLLYAFHVSNLFDVRNSDMKDIVVESYDVPKEYDYVLQTDLLLSDKFSVLSFKLINTKTKETVTSYNYPFMSLNIYDLENVMRQNAMILSMSLLSNEEQKKVGTAEIIVSGGPKAQKVYCNDYYLGISDQKNLLLPFGANDIQIENRMYKMFVLPYLQTNTYWKAEGSFMTQFINLLQ